MNPSSIYKYQSLSKGYCQIKEKGARYVLTQEEREDATAEDTMRGRFIPFAVDREMYGIEIRYVTEIVGIQPTNSLPEAPEHIKGIINLRSKIIPVVDMRLKFKKEPMAYNDRTYIIVIDTQEITAGLIVDEVSEVLAIDDANILPPPKHETGANCRYLSGIGNVTMPITEKWTMPIRDWGNSLMHLMIYFGDRVNVQI